MKRILVLASIAPLAACSPDMVRTAMFASSADESRPVTQPLSTTIQSVDRSSDTGLRNMQVTSLVDGSSMTYKVQPHGQGVRVTEGDGCAWTRASDWFSPSDSWANCGTSKNWHTAQATVREVDSLYPLAVGSTGRYERNAVSHTGRTYTRETSCEVSDTVEVLRPGREATPAFVVDCDDTRRLRTTWYAPGEGPIAYRVVHGEKGVEEAWIRSN